MAEPSEKPPDEAGAQVAQPGRPDAPYPAPDQPGLNLPLLVGLLVILGLVVASNVWLRRRAERERERQ